MSRASRSGVVLAVAVAGCVAFRVIGDAVSFPWSDDWTEPLLKLAFWVAPCAVMLRLWGVAGYPEVAYELGLTGVAARGYGFGLLSSVPVVFALPFGRDLHGVPAPVLISTILIGPFAEEVLFRGWVFRQLWRRAGWHPALALVASAIAFGMAHAIPSAGDLWHLRWADWRYGYAWPQMTLPLNAAAAGVLFAWLTWRWRSLWPAIGLHTCMNLSWQLLGGYSTRGAGYDPNVPNAIRLATIGLAVVWTVVLRRSGTGRRALDTGA